MKTRRMNSTGARRVLACAILGISALVSWRMLRTAPARELSAPVSVLSGSPAPSLHAEPAARRELAEENATERVLQTYGEEAARLNREKPEGEAARLPDEAFVARAISGALEEALPIPLFTKDELRVIVAPTSTDYEAYQDTFQKELRRNTATVTTHFLSAVSLAVGGRSTDALRGHHAAALAEVDALLALSVPAPLVPLHLEVLNMWQARRVIAQAILEADADPIRSMRAVQALPEEQEREARIASLLDALP